MRKRQWRAACGTLSGASGHACEAATNLRTRQKLTSGASDTVASLDVASSRLSPSSVALYPFPLRCIVACHCHSIHSFAVQSHSGPRRSISLSLLPSDQHALPSRSVAGLPVLLRIGCDAQLACASRLSRFTLLGNDPTLRGLHPCISHRYPTVPFRGARRTNTVTGGLSRGMQRQAVRLLQR